MIYDETRGALKQRLTTVSELISLAQLSLIETDRSRVLHGPRIQMSEDSHCHRRYLRSE
jgi:hypothetical protein